MMTQSRYLKAKKVTLVGACCNSILAAIKIIVGLLGQSHALLADGIHSVSDLLTDVLVLVASKFGSQDADESHPYGHRRIETAATMFLALLLVVVGAFISFDGLSHMLIKSTAPSMGVAVLSVTLFSIITNESLYHYTRFYGVKLDSRLLIANAWHHRSDAASSLVVLVGLIGSLMGYHYCDALAAVIVGLMIVKMGGTLAWSSVSELVDSSVEKKLLKAIETQIKSTFGVVAIHQLRTRSMAGAILVDVHVLVGERLSVSEGHHIAQNVALDLCENFQAISDVTVHIDPEDDEKAKPCVHLPSREVLLTQLDNRCGKIRGFEKITEVVIHYLDGKVVLDVLFIGDEIDLISFDAEAMKINNVNRVRYFSELLKDKVK
jgi:cation diffusion facilitator family transporter